MKFLSLVFIVILKVSCGRGGSGPGASTAVQALGVGQGNGLKTFNSSEGYSLSYNSQLLLTHKERGGIRIDNSPLIDISLDSNQGKSFIEVKKIPNVSESRVKDEKGLIRYVREIYPEKEWLKKKFPGAVAFFNEDKMTNQLIAHYFILTTNNDLFEITLNAYNEANGLKWVAPIVNTLTYDAHAPTVHEVKFDDTFGPGKSNQVFFRITDDYSGVDRINVWLHSINLYNGKPVQLYAHEFEKLEDDLYLVKLDIHQYVAPGKYTVSYEVTDKVYNSTPIFSEEGEEIIEITNSGLVDTEGPKIKGFNIESKNLVAGRGYKVTFEITDNLSGLDLRPMHFMGQKNTIPKSGFSEELRSLGKNHYEIYYWVNEYAPSGRYKLDGLSFRDNAGNFSDWQAPEDFFIQVQNNAKVDVTGPKVHEVRIIEPLAIGGVGKIAIRMTDDVSGILDENSGIPMVNASIRMVHKKNKRFIWESIPNLKPVGGDWYEGFVEISKFEAAGEYEQVKLRVTDQALNDTVWKASSEFLINVSK